MEMGSPRSLPMSVFHLPLILLITIQLLPFSLSTTTTGVATTGFHFNLVHVDGHLNLTDEERVLRAVHRGHHRLLSMLHNHRRGWRSRNLATTAPALLHHHHHHNAKSFTDRLEMIHGDYLMTLSIGTPPITYSAVFDTGSDLVWVQCADCLECLEETAPIYYNPRKSSSFSQLSCSDPHCVDGESTCGYKQVYADSSHSDGNVGYETFTLSTGIWTSISVKNMTFGCGLLNTGIAGGTGMVGMNRGPASLISQLGALVDHRFSYCLSGFISSAGSRISFGPRAAMRIESKATFTTPMVASPPTPAGYFVNLNGISVAGKRLPIPASAFVFDHKGDGGVALDAGAMLTYLVPEAYSQVRAAFVEAIKRPIVPMPNSGIDLCFSGLPTTMSIPEPMTFHFQGGDLNLVKGNYIFGSDQNGGLTCLAINPSPFGVSLFGNLMQQNVHIMYDLKRELITFTPAQCDQL